MNYMIIRRLKNIVIGLLLLLAIVACQPESKLMPIGKLVVSVNMPAELKDTLRFAHKIVTLRSQRLMYTALTNKEGVAEFRDLVPDIYNIYTSWDLTGDEYVDMADSLVENKPALISGINSNVNIFSEDSIQLKTLLSVKQSLLISKVYASGTRDNNNLRYIADQYVEIFNNSDETQYMDGIYMALVEGDSPIGFPASLFPSTLHARQIYRFPGFGKQYPVLPGKSVVICNSARNHSNIAPTSVNLQNADFEFKSLNYPNNDAIPAMLQVFTSYLAIREINLQLGGVNSLCLFSTNDDLSFYPIEYKPGSTSGNRFLRFIAEDVIDGVEILRYKATGVDVNSKRFQNFIDAAYITLTNTGGLNHESIERKVDTQRSTATRIYLKDTNNSQSDFVIVNDPTPSKYDKPLLLQ